MSNNMNPMAFVDFYKPHHHPMYPEGMTKLYSNLCPRKSRIPGINSVVWFGFQHFAIEYLIKRFNEDFFGSEFERKNKWAKGKMLKEYEKVIPIDTKHIGDLWELGYLPIEIKALPEGTLCPIGVPCMTITNTHPDFAWLVNYLETLISCMLWQPITSATIAYEYKKLLTKYALETTGSADFVQWQGHDFSMRGMSSVESAILSGMGHLTSFTGSDTIPAIYQLEESYFGKGLIGASVPATEHSIQCMYGKEDEVGAFKRLLSLYPTGILSVVSDTWDLWKVLTEYLPAIKSEILTRDGKLVIRPDSGDPVDIICGIQNGYGYNAEFPYFETMEAEHKRLYGSCKYTKPQFKGVIELLWDIFGGTLVTGNDGKQYKQLDSHIGAIYGDSITLDRAEQICKRLQAKGFASTNIVLGIGSYTYQYNTRDTFGFAMKATYGEIQRCGKGRMAGCTCEGKCEHLEIEAREIWKDPITDDGVKRSKKGLLQVCYDPNGGLVVYDQCTLEQETKGELKTVFKDGKLVKTTTLDEIRAKLTV